MSYRPRFKHCFRCEVAPSAGLFLLSEKGRFLLRGAAYLRLAPYLDGRYTVEEILHHLQDHLSAPEVMYALDLLKQKGYLVDAATPLPSEQAAFWEMLDVDLELAARRLHETAVSVVALGDLDPAPLASLLASLGIRTGDHEDRRVVLTDDYLRKELDAFNREALALDQPWMLAKPVGAEVWVGPAVSPHRSACWACLAHRLRGHRKVEHFLQRTKGLSDAFPTSFSILPSTLQMALGIVATEIAKWIVLDGNERLEGHVVTLNTLTFEQHDHVLVRRPQCPQCGNPQALAATQLARPALQRRKKHFTTDGGHRTATPQETFKKHEHHISPITGIASTIVSAVTSEDENRLIHSYVADHSFVSLAEDLSLLRKSLRARSGGKGKYYMQAKASALCESIERYSGVFQGDEPRRHARLQDLGTAAIAPPACLLFSERQFAQREQWNARGSTFNWVPEPFDEDAAIDWSPVWSLTDDEQRYVPTAYCYYGYAAPFARADSNGCAAGNCKEEAILQGFLELVERDSIALWWYNRLKRPALDPAGFGDLYFPELQAYYRTLHRALWVLDITSDLNIPTFTAISPRIDRQREDIILGFGTHFDPQIALLRALTELNQLLPAVHAVSNGKEYPIDDPEILSWWRSATVANQPYLTPDTTLPLKTQADYPLRGSDDLLEDVMTCVSIAREKGLETLVLNQTRPDTGLDVVKVIVPGLRHFWARFGPGRLYEVPVQLGWLDEPLAEEGLNPIPLFL